MRVKLDENLPDEVAADLRERGHDVATVDEEGLAGRADLVIVAAARSEGRILGTLDKGIGGQLARRGRKPLPPIILLRLRSSGRRSVRSAVVRSVEILAGKRSEFTTAVVTDADIRLRR